MMRSGKRSVISFASHSTKQDRISTRAWILLTIRDFAIELKGLVTLQPQHPLQTHGADSVLLAGHVSGGTKLERQRQVAVLKDGPGGHRNLVVPSRTSHKKVGFRPTLSSTAARTAKALRPAEIGQVLPAIRLGRKSGLQLHQIAGIIFYAPEHYRLGLRESSKYPSLTIWITDNYQVVDLIGVPGGIRIRVAAVKVT